MDPISLNKLLGEVEEVAYGGAVVAKNKKRQFKHPLTENSEEFKQLGSLHKENRLYDYFP